MTRALRVAESAAAELAEAVRRLEEQRPGLGLELYGLINTAFDSIAKFADAGSEVGSVRDSRFGAV